MGGRRSCREVDCFLLFLVGKECHGCQKEEKTAKRKKNCASCASEPRLPPVGAGGAPPHARDLTQSSELEMIANGCAQQPGPLSKSAEVCIGGVSTRLIATAYANRIFVVVSQRENLGTLISATRESATGLASGPGCYSTRVLLGRRDDEALEVLCATVRDTVPSPRGAHPSSPSRAAGLPRDSLLGGAASSGGLPGTRCRRAGVRAYLGRAHQQEQASGHRIPQQAGDERSHTLQP